MSNTKDCTQKQNVSHMHRCTISINALERTASAKTGSDIRSVEMYSSLIYNIGRGIDSATQIKFYSFYKIKFLFFNLKSLSGSQISCISKKVN